jgi:hypothetical protein
VPDLDRRQLKKTAVSLNVAVFRRLCLSLSDPVDLSREFIMQLTGVFVLVHVSIQRQLLASSGTKIIHVGISDQQTAQLSSVPTVGHHIQSLSETLLVENDISPFRHSHLFPIVSCSRAAV